MQQLDRHLSNYLANNARSLAKGLTCRLHLNLTKVSGAIGTLRVFGGDSKDLPRFFHRFFSHLEVFSVMVFNRGHYVTNPNNALL